jgi:hypothetical protein
MAETPAAKALETEVHQQFGLVLHAATDTLSQQCHPLATQQRQHAAAAAAAAAASSVSCMLWCAIYSI